MQTRAQAQTHRQPQGTDDAPHALQRNATATQHARAPPDCPGASPALDGRLRCRSGPPIPPPSRSVRWPSVAWGWCVSSHLGHTHLVAFEGFHWSHRTRLLRRPTDPCLSPSTDTPTLLNLTSPFSHHRPSRTIVPEPLDTTHRLRHILFRPLTFSSAWTTPPSGLYLSSPSIVLALLRLPLQQQANWCQPMTISATKP